MGRLGSLDGNTPQVHPEAWVAPGGLTRVAPDYDSYLVNSSAGGGIKDTWVEA